MKGKKTYKNDPFAKCDGCGARTYKESDRHYKEKWACGMSLGFPRMVVENYCDKCDKEGLRAIIEEMILESQKDKSTS